MDHPIDDLRSGDRLKQEDIEGIFDTGFGYQISGINPRRDSEGQRYILLFSREGGPYADEITSDEFRYVGEGLDEDQSESSPGNSVLIDAITESVPIYFFHKKAGASLWEYRGLVDVDKYEREEQENREVLVFTMHHLDGTPVTSPGLYLQPVSDEWIDDFNRTVRSPLRLTAKEGIPEQFEGLQHVRVWGTTETKDQVKKSHVEQLQQGDIIVYYRNKSLFGLGKVERVIENSDIGEWLWGTPESRHIYTLAEYRNSAPAIESLWESLDYDENMVVRKFMRVQKERVDNLVRAYGSIEEALSGEHEPTDKEIEHEKRALEQYLQTEPQLKEDQTEYVEGRRRARDPAFRELVLKTYENTCAVCGKSRESPNGTPEVEAAHIYPKSEGGRDDVRNGIALCKLHHWCFDTGWISITSDYDISILEVPDRTGYEEFKQLEGNSLHLPENDDLKPAKLYLKERRKLM